MIAEFESRILALIDDMVDHASDDELFAGGYLRGHLTLAVAELEGEGEHTAQAVHDKVSRSLEKAISAGELSPPDQVLVQEMWNSLYLTHSLLGFSAASVSLSIGNGSLLICDARISAASGAEHRPREPSAPNIYRLR